MGAEHLVAEITKKRIGETTDNKEWRRAEDDMRRKQRAELTKKMLLGGGAPQPAWTGPQQQEVRTQSSYGRGQGAGKGGGKGTKPLDAPVVSRDPNLTIGPFQPDHERRDFKETCSFCGGPHAASWECSALGSWRWKFSQGLVDRWKTPIHQRQGGPAPPSGQPPRN